MAEAALFVRTQEGQGSRPGGFANTNLGGGGADLQTSWPRAAMGHDLMDLFSINDPEQECGCMYGIPCTA